MLDAAPGQDELEICIGQPLSGLNQYTKVPVPSHFAAEQMQSFADLLLGRGDGLSATIRDGYINQQTVDAVITSFEQHTWVTLQPNALMQE
jgi:predicted dehydrogenase